ncbi:hypothetical protein T484DRAFT_1812903 [Baffinella frigidus]|nr:hypothetical protein T484DRAFT_1812903 [Cryptophyta sp. CCMP2293]
MRRLACGTENSHPVLTHRISWTTPSRLTLLERYLDAAKEASDPLTLNPTLLERYRDAAKDASDPLVLALRA